MTTRLSRISAVFALTLSLSACAFGTDVVGGSLANVATEGSCRAPGPHDAAGPGDLVCQEPNGDVVTLPAHRVQ